MRYDVNHPTALLFIITLFQTWHGSHQLTTTTTTTATTTTTKTHTNRIVWFRDHALRIQDNEAISKAIIECGQEVEEESKLPSLSSSSSSSSSSSHSFTSSIIPIYLWDKDIMKEASGGTASDLFIAHTLKSINEKLDGMLGQGAIVRTTTATVNTNTNTNTIAKTTPSIIITDEDYLLPTNVDIDAFIHEKVNTIAKELYTICQATDTSEIYYILSTNQPFEEKLAHQLRQLGITPNGIFGGSLLEYSNIDVPWKDIILAHPYRSPLIPFVDYVLDSLSHDPPSDVVDIPMDVLLPKLKQCKSNAFSNHVDVNLLVDKLGKSPSGYDWGKSCIEAFCSDNHNDDDYYDAMEEVHSFLQSLGPKGAEKKTHFTSRLSPYLARGILSPRQLFHAMMLPPSEQDGGNQEGRYKDADKDSFIRRICWRDYTHAVVSLFPHVLYGRPIRKGYEDDLKELNDDSLHLLEAWKKGVTGIPLIDAGMRQLIKEGFMPQKVRLACSTCLVEGLNIPWQYGMHHFKEFLIDYDVNINCNMWQNAGCVGLDPYYTGIKYRKRAYWDVNGEYVRKWCPELKKLPNTIVLRKESWDEKRVDCLYEPWTAPKEVLEKAGVELGSNYPHRVCDDRSNRQSFFSRLRDTRDEWKEGMIDERKRDIISLGQQGEIGVFTPRALQRRSEVSSRR